MFLLIERGSLVLFGRKFGLLIMFESDLFLLGIVKERNDLFE